MSTSAVELREWFDRGKAHEDKPTHMVIVTDTFSYEDYPVYTSDPHSVVSARSAEPMTRVMEVYDLKRAFWDQDSPATGRKDLAWSLP